MADLNSEKKGMELDELSLKRLKRAGRWGMFIGVLGLTALGVLIAGGALAGTFLAAFNSDSNGSGIPDELIVAAALAAGIVCLFPVVFVLRFSKFITSAVTRKSEEALKKAVRNLSLYFTYIGILLIIFLVVYVAAVIISGSSLSLV